MNEETEVQEQDLEYTEQQITDYCEKVENMCLSCRSEGKLLFEGVQIIKQLQELSKQARRGFKGKDRKDVSG